MAPTGKGEVAVPTGGTFKACQRIFKDDPRGVRTVVKAVDEYNTTKVDWETGETKELVYRVVRLAAGQRPDDPYALSTAPSLGHVAGKTPPFAPTQDRAVLARHEPGSASVAKDGLSSSSIRSFRFCTSMMPYLDLSWASHWPSCTRRT